MLTLGAAHALLPGSTLVGSPSVRLARVHSDTRSIATGDFFVALRGAHFDAHDFLPQARAAGAAAALAEHGLAAAGLAGLQVADTLAALAELAVAWRRSLDLPLIAVTGSNGKTTVTQMIFAVLRAWLGDAAFGTEGNLNNHIGVPLTLLRLRQDDETWHRAGVVELGMNHPGEIARLAAMCAPNVVLVNNAQREHQEFMHDVDAVARENGAALAALGASGTAVFPADDDRAPLWHEIKGTRPSLTFALQGEADVTGDAQWRGDAWQLELQTPAGAATARLHAPGRHNLKNALAAATCALAVGCPLAAIARGLDAFRPVAGRSELRLLTRHDAPLTLVDDSYNANPDSVRAAIDVLAALPRPRWLVLGDMGEVGDQGPAFHAEVGAYAATRGIDALWLCGPLTAHAADAFPGAHRFDSVAALTAALLAAMGDASAASTFEAPSAARRRAPRCRSIVIKGSRFMRMERVVRALVGDEAAHAA